MAKYTKETDVLFQYSQGFRLIVPNAYKTCHTQFYSVDYPNGLAIAPSSYIVEGGKTYCPVPNQMTVKPNSIIVFAYLLEESRAITESKTVLEVWERPKPPDFVFDPTDTVTYAAATELISDMEATLGKFTNVSASATDGVTAQASASISETGLEFTFVLPKGNKGDTGVSIATVSFKEYDSNGGAVYTITMDNGTTTTFTAPKGSQGDKGNTGDTGATISSVTFKEYDSNGGAVYTITMTDGVTAEFTAPKGQKGDKGDIGDTGATGNGIESVTLVSGTHAAGTTDTYRITFTNGETADFTVYNGANGEGAGDMLWEEFNARLNPSGKNGQIAFESEVTAHTDNTDIHVTTDNKTAWDSKPELFNIYVSQDRGTREYFADKTFDEILAAYNAGNILKISLSGSGGIFVSYLSSGNRFEFNVPDLRSRVFITSSTITVEDASMYVPVINTSDAGKMLMVNSSGKAAWAEATPSGSSGVDVFLVTFTPGNNANWTVDKTYAEIVAALEAGKIILCTAAGIYFGRLVNFVPPLNTVWFRIESYTDANSNGGFIVLTINSANEVNYRTIYHYSPTFSQYTVLTSGWSNGVYSFEEHFPSTDYDIEVELDSTATESQVEAWSNAKVTSVFGTNTMKALGDVPTVDIPVIVKKVVK